MDKKDISNNGVTFLQLLFLLFLGLKLGNVINWSWWWVFSPIWIPIAAIAAFIVILVVFLLIENLIKNSKKKNEN